MRGDAIYESVYWYAGHLAEFCFCSMSLNLYVGYEAGPQVPMVPSTTHISFDMYQASKAMQTEYTAIG